MSLFATLWTVTARLLCPWDSPGKNTGVGYHALLQRIFPTQGSNLRLFCLCIGRQVLNHYHHLGSIDTFVVQSLSHVQLFATPWTATHQASCPSPSPGACWNSCPWSRWCHPTILSSVVPFYSYHQSFPESGSFPVSWLFTSGGQSIGASALTSVLPMNVQGWFPVRLTDLILQSKGLSRVFSSTRVWKHHFFHAQPSLWSNFHIRTWLLEKP